MHIPLFAPIRRDFMNPKERQQFLADLVKINTAGGHEDQLAHYLATQFQAHHINCQLIPVEPGRSNVLASIGTGSGPTLALSGHQDTVLIGDLAKWDFDPLGATIKDGKMYGRGTTDMKAGLAAQALALIELADEGYSLGGTLQFMATIAEESSEHNHMQGAAYFANNGYVKNVDALIIGEPTEKSVVYAHKGSITYQVTSKGVAAHSSTPERGYNAITPLIDYYNLQKQYFDTLTATNQYLGPTVPVVTKIDGGMQLNSVPEAAELFVKVRTIPEVTNETIINHLTEIINRINQQDQAQLELVIIGNKFPVITEPTDPFIQLLQTTSQRILEHEVPLSGWAAGTDASELIKGNPQMKVSILGPGNASIHKVNENVDLKTFTNFVDLYKEIAKQFCK